MAGTDGYVQITRHFRDISVEPQPTIMRSLRSRVGGRSATLDWNSLLRPYGGQADATVVIAPSGAGKSTEVWSQVRRLVADGHDAFFAEAAAVVTDELRSAISSESTSFETWRASSRPAVFFIDALDEVRLRQRTTQDLVRRIERDIDLVTRQVQFVFTTRNGTWTPADASAIGTLVSRGSGDPTIQMVVLEPVDDDAIRALASARGVRDVDAFCVAFAEDRLWDLVELRPLDVELFASYWNNHRRFGSWTEMLREFLGASLDDLNEARAEHNVISREAATGAMRRIAAAAVLTRTPHIRLPAFPQRPHTIDSRTLFSDWPPSEVPPLFTNTLFVPKGEGIVQLPQGAISSWLGANWFAERFKHGCQASELRDLLFVRVFGEEERVLPPSRRAVAGWLASELPEFRAYLLQIEPSTLLLGGDASQLTPAEISVALDRLVKEMLTRRIDDLASQPTIRKLARPELEIEVIALLRRHRSERRVARFLLDWCRLGRYRTAGSLAIELATDQSLESSTRANAIKTAGELCESAELAALVPLVGEQDSEMRATLLDVLAPAHLSGTRLSEFLLSASQDHFQYSVSAVLDRLSIAEIDSLIDDLMVGVERDGLDRYRLTLAIWLATVRLARELNSTGKVGVLLRLIDANVFNRDTFPRGSEIDKLNGVLATHGSARRAFWRDRIDSILGNPHMAWNLHRPRLAPLQSDDIEWLDREALIGSDEAPQAIVGGWYEQASEEQRERVRSRPLSPAFVETFQRVDTQREHGAVLQQQRNRSSEVEHAQALEHNVRELTPLRRDIESGTRLDLLTWAWHNSDKGYDTRRVDRAKLFSLVGEELADSFITGFKACWRHQEPPPRDPCDNSIPLSTIAGLTGLTMDIQDGLEVSTLTPTEAELAARYALYEPNSFPPWIEDLFSTHPNSVRRVLAGVLAQEWDADYDQLGIVRFAGYYDTAVTSFMQSTVVDLLLQRPPRSATTINLAASAIVSSRIDGPRALPAVRQQAENTRQDSDATKYDWIRAWAHLAPEEAAEWLEFHRDVDRARFRELTMQTASLIADDLDERKHLTESAFKDVAALERWIRVLYVAIPPSKRIEREGLHALGKKEQVEQLINVLVARLTKDTSIDSHRALRRLAGDAHLQSLRGYLEYVAEQQRLGAAEVASSWREEDILRIERRDEKHPHSLFELFELVRRHLANVASLIEGDDFSYRSLLKPDTPEIDIQKWVASSLRLISRGLYSVVRENVVDDDKEVDISALVAGIGRVPIEIKPLGDYSLNELKSCIEHQLAGRYMRTDDVKYGVLLLVRLVEKQWQVDGNLTGFEELTRAVRQYAGSFGGSRGKVIYVATIDARLVRN